MIVLIVDDIATNRKLLRAVLEAEDMTVFEAANGVEALAVLEREKIDAIISDILMPRMDGYRLCQEVRASERFCALPFIFYTATYTSPGDEKLSLDVGADKFFKKPVGAAVLIDALNETVKKARRRQPKMIPPAQELYLMKEYNERLVAKLENKNIELAGKVEALLRAEQQLRLQGAALEAAADAIMIADRKGAILWVNPAFTTLTGYTAKEALGQNPRLLKSGKQDQSFYRHLWETINSGQTWRGNFINRRKDGSLYEDEHTITPICTKGGTVTHFVGIMHDVTDRKRVEEALRQAHEKVEHLLAHSPAVIYSLKLDGPKITPVVVSENIERLLGITAESTHYEWWLGSLHPEDRDRTIAALDNGLKQDGYSVEYRIRHKNGTYRWVEDNNRVIRDEAGNPSAAVGVWTDITERKQAEAEQERLTRAMQLLLESTGEGINGVDLEGRCTFINKAGAKMLGYQPEEMMGRNTHELFHHHKPNGFPYPMEECPISRACRAGQRCRVDTEVFWRKDGKAFPVEYSSHPILEGSTLKGAVVVFSDITEKKKMEAQSLRNDRLESIGTLAGGIAHDLNNVLAPIQMAIHMLRAKYPDAEDTMVLDTLQSSTQRGAEMVRQVLAFSRGTEGKRGAVQVKHLIREIQMIVTQTFPKFIELDSNVPNDLWTIHGDATQLHQVLMNLCVNARDAMPQGGKLSIKAENFSLDEHYARMNPESKPGPYLVITVADTGTGIPPAIRERIFDPFFTTKELGKGTGLGLSTVRGIAKSHGGFITLYSEVGKGTQFKVYLPAEETAAVQRAQEETKTPAAGNGELVLVVDDEAGIRDITKQALEMYGYHVLVARHGAEAVAVCAQNLGRIKLMLTDMMMPIMDGTATIHAVRSLDPQIKIIAASGLGDEARQTEPKKLGVDAFLHKPYTAEKLLHTVHEVLHAK